MFTAIVATAAIAGGATIPLPLIGLLAVGVPALIMAVFFVMWNDKPSK